MTITIKDIAKMANVSTATVSRVLNQAGGYNEETKKKILQVADTLGYRRNEMARSLVKKSSNLIGIIMPDVSTIFYADIVNGIENEAQRNGYNVILAHAGDKGVRVVDCLKMMEERKVDGLIIVSILLEKEQIKALQSLSVPFILISSDTEDGVIPFIKVNDFEASYAATEYLIRNGHRKIGLAGVDPLDRVAGIPRVEGYKKALQTNSIPFNQDYICYGDYSFSAGKASLKKYLEKQFDLTAVFAVSDEVALGIISAAYEAGIQIPKQLSVIGYDNTRVAEMAIPALTSMEQPFWQMGTMGCRKIIEAIQDNKTIRSEEFPFQLIERQTVSTRALN